MNPLIFRDLSGLGEGIVGASSVLGSALARSQQQKQQQQQQLQQQSALNKALSIYQENPSPMGLVNLLSEGQRAGIPPETLKLYQQALLPQIQENLKRETGSNFLQSLGLFGQQPQVETEIDISTMSEEEPVVEGAPATKPIMQQNNPLANLSDTQLAAMAASDIPQAKRLADFELKRRDGARKEFRDDRNFAYKRAGKFLEKIDADRKRIQDQSEALFLMEDAIKEQDMGFFSKDNFANFLGRFGEGLRTAKGAQLLNAQKEFLISDIGRVGSRQNQWIEQQISSALTKTGRDKYANLTVVEALKSRIARDKKRIELADELEEKYQKELGYVPGNISSLVDQAMKPYEEKISNRLAYNLRSLYEEENKEQLEQLSKQKVPRGTPLTIETAAIFLDRYKTKEKARENAERLGYSLLSPEEYKEFTK